LNISWRCGKVLYWWNLSASLGERDCDIGALDDKMKSAGLGSLQLLRAHQGFKEKLRTVLSS
jgi:hypothetical protein